MSYTTGFAVCAVSVVLLSMRVCAASITRRSSRQLYEHDQCGSDGWICLKLEVCPLAREAIRRGERPRLCGFDGSHPIACCPGNSTPSKPQLRNNTAMNPEVSKSLGESKSQIKCNEYSATLCKLRTITFNLPFKVRTLVKGGIPARPKESPFTCMTYSQQLCENRLGIVGGTESHPKEFPHMALIGYGSGPDNISWQCGGTLISENFVLSAAHCTLPGPQVGLAKYVRIGDLNTASDTDDAKPQQFEIIERIDHPEYRPPVLYNDIALYRLDRNATFDDYVRPVCLHQSYSLPEGAGVATGWGRTEFAGPVSKNLQKANLTYIDSVRCNELLKSTLQLPRGVDEESMVCAGESDGSKDTCQGDSGGPLAMQKHLQETCLAAQVGITSFGRQCGLPNSPGVYTRVAHFIPWIESIVWPGPV